MLNLNRLAKAATVAGLALLKTFVAQPARKASAEQVKVPRIISSDMGLLKAIREITSWFQRLGKGQLRTVFTLIRFKRSRSRLWIGAAVALLLILSRQPQNLIGVANAASVAYIGVNLSGAEYGAPQYGSDGLPGTYNANYTYPTHTEIDYFIGKGMTLFRVPFRWERLQKQQFGDFDADEVAHLSDVVNYATSKGATVWLDVHNYARYYGGVIAQDVPVSAFADFWSKLANLYQSNSQVIFGLMNEPNSMSSEVWRDDANAAIQAIRNTGASNLIVVSGNAWSGGYSWNLSWYGTSNATAMLGITDPGNNYAFEIHQYLDSDNSGTSDQCYSLTIGSDSLVGVTAWLRQNGKRAFLGEFSVPNNDFCINAGDNMLSYLDSNNDVWLGWTYWAADPYRDYTSTLQTVSKHIGR